MMRRVAPGTMRPFQLEMLDVGERTQELGTPRPAIGGDVLEVRHLQLEVSDGLHDPPEELACFVLALVAAVWEKSAAVGEVIVEQVQVHPRAILAGMAVPTPCT